MSLALLEVNSLTRTRKASYFVPLGRTEAEKERHDLVMKEKRKGKATIRKVSA